MKDNMGKTIHFTTDTWKQKWSGDKSMAFYSDYVYNIFNEPEVKLLRHVVAIIYHLEMLLMNDTFPPPWNPQLNLTLSFKRHPGSVWLACGWCGLRVKGPIAYVADYTPVDKAFMCCGQRALSPRRPMLTEYRSGFPPSSFQTFLVMCPLFSGFYLL